jgi:hypothetical protein
MLTSHPRSPGGPSSISWVRPGCLAEPRPVRSGGQGGGRKLLTGDLRAPRVQRRPPEEREFRPPGSHGRRRPFQARSGDPAPRVRLREQVPDLYFLGHPGSVGREPGCLLAGSSSRTAASPCPHSGTDRRADLVEPPGPAPSRIPPRRERPAKEGRRRRQAPASGTEGAKQERAQRDALRVGARTHARGSLSVGADCGGRRTLPLWASPLTSASPKSSAVRRTCLGWG